MSAEPRPPHFVEQIVASDNASKAWGVWTQADAGPLAEAGPKGDAARARLGAPRVHTRFPPEPNGYLHIGHAKAICLNYALARDNGGKFNLRFDDTNPAKEEQEFVDSIIRDVRWLGADFDGPHGGGLHYASNYFGTMYDYAVELIKKGNAYVCELPADEVSKRRGTPTVPGTSPLRDRAASESLRLIDEMRRGMHPDGSMTVRARIDMASPNFNLRDPVLYRILHEHHHNTGTDWCIYPMYDWAHGIEDSLEGVTHSNCTLEFENHRPLYDWFIDAINDGRTEDGSGPWGRLIHHPRQIEFAKLQLSSILLSKRNLRRMVEEGFVAGWDDPRMPTLSAFRRRGFTPESIRALCDDVGCTKFESLIDIARLENACRDHLNRVAPRAMAVLNPLKVMIENWPEGKVDQLNFVINPEDPGAGTRTVPFTRTIYIEREDFMENPEKGFFRLAPGAEVRLRWAYFLTCTGVEKDAHGSITGIRATIDLSTRGGDAPIGPDGKPTKKVKGTIHWVSCEHALPAEVRLYDRLFTTDEPGKATGKWEDDINPNALTVVRAFVDPVLSAARYRPGFENGADVGDRFQFERLGYFCVDPDSGSDFGGRGGAAGLVLSRTVTLKDSRPKAAKA